LDFLFERSETGVRFGQALAAPLITLDEANRTLFYQLCKSAISATFTVKRSVPH
jgi:hypothetical protein